MEPLFNTSIGITSVNNLLFKAAALLLNALERQKNQQSTRLAITSSIRDPPGMVGGKHNVLVHYADVCAPDLSGVVHCNPFK